jgi:hypothetical protein
MRGGLGREGSDAAGMKQDAEAAVLEPLEPVAAALDALDAEIQSHSGRSSPLKALKCRWRSHVYRRSLVGRRGKPTS